MKKAEKIILTLFLFLLSFVPFLWLSNGQLILGYDAVFPLNPAAFLLDRIYSWTSTQGFTMDQSGIQGSLVIHFIDSIPYFFGFSASNAQKIVFSFWFFAMLFSSYIFIVRIEKAGFIESRYMRYFFPVLYTFNFYILQAWWAIERTKFSLVVATPLILSIILPMIKEKLSIWKIFRYAVLCSLILSIFNGGGWVGFPLYGGLFVMLGCYYLFFSLILILNSKIKKWLLINVFFIFLILWYLLLNAYTLLPFIMTTVKSYGDIVSGAGGISGLISWTRYISNDASFLNLFRLQGIPDWYNNGRFHPYSSYYLNYPILVFSSFLIPLFVVLSFIIKHKKNNIIVPFFLLTLIVSAFFTAGARPPLGFIFEFLMKVVPGFVAFRSAIFKFGYAYWFSMGFLISLFLSSILVLAIGKIKNVRLVNYAGITFAIAIVSLILLYHFPFLTGNIFRIDPTNVSARVSVPSYVFEFSKWWKENGKDNKILLLPKLNDNWGFEQYNWNYMSLFPVTGNFGSSGIIENAVVLSENENITINELYSAIEDGNNEKVDFLLSILGIRYFLVRRDFYYDYPNQSTDNPLVIEQKLIENPKIKFINAFEEWILYEHLGPKSLVTAESSSVVSVGKADLDEMLSMKAGELIIEDNILDDYPQTYSKILVNPTCLNCLAEKETKEVTFPIPRVLIDSSLYQFVELRDKLKIKKNESIEERVNRLIGNSIRLIGQIEQLIEQDREEYYVDVAKNKYISVVNEISENLPIIFVKSNNPYFHIISIEQYLDEEDRHLNKLISSRVERKEILRILGEALYAIQNVRSKLTAYYDSDKDYNMKKIYKFTIKNSGNYNIRVKKDSIGNIDESDLQSSTSLSLDSVASQSGRVDDFYVNFESKYLEEGEHVARITLPPQINTLSLAQYEKLAGKNCYSSYVNNFSVKKDYSLSFKAKNNFDASFFFFIDHGKSFSPIAVNNIIIAGEQVRDTKMVVSARKMQLEKGATMLRISFCAASLTEDLYKSNIKNLSFVELTSPLLYLSKNVNDNFLNAPKISFNEINQTHFKVYVKQAIAPYFLVFRQRYEQGWEASVGQHLLANRFQNAWFIDKVGNYEIDISYKPQIYFNKGAVISGFFLIVSFILFFVKNKNDKYK